MSGIIAGIVANALGTTGQEKAGEALASMVSKEICDGIRKAFEGPLLEQYTELLKEVAEEWKEKRIFIEKVKDIIKKIDVAEFKVESKDPALQEGGKKDGDKTNKNLGSEIMDTIGFDKNAGKEMIGNMSKDIPGAFSAATSGLSSLGDLKKIQNNVLNTTKNLTDSVSGATKAGISSITDTLKTEANPLSLLTSGLAPGGEVVPNYLSEGLNKEAVENMMTEGIKNLVTYLTVTNPDKIAKMFMDILKEQINAKFNEEPGSGEFKQVIIDTIQKKCTQKMNDDAEEEGEILGDAEDGEEEGKYGEEGEEGKEGKDVVENEEEKNDENNNNKTNEPGEIGKNLLNNLPKLPINTNELSNNISQNASNPLSRITNSFDLGKNISNEASTNNPVFSGLLKAGKSKKRTTRKIKTKS